MGKGTNNISNIDKVKTKRIYIYKSLIVIGLIAVAVTLGFAMKGQIETLVSTTRIKNSVPDYVDVQLITVDGHARRGVKLEGVNYIVVHYVGNPGSSAQANRNYFNNKGTTVSSHFVIGLDGEIIMCVPLDEKSSASNERNRDSISIEVCHEDETGKFNEKTYTSLVRLTAWLCREYDLDPETSVIRHYDVTGKLCPLYFVEHEDAWQTFKEEVAEYEE